MCVAAAVAFTVVTATVAVFTDAGSSRSFRKNVVPVTCGIASALPVKPSGTGAGVSKLASAATVSTKKRFEPSSVQG